MGGSTNSLDSLSSPSPSPPPSLSRAEGSVLGSASTKPKSAEPAAGLDSDSELSELTEEEQDEKQKHKQKQKKSEISSLSPGAARSSSSNRRGTASTMRGGPRRGGRKKRSTLVPAPMWGWAMYGSEQDTENHNAGGEEIEGDDGKEAAHILHNHISAPNPLDVLTSAALSAENSEQAFARLKSDSQETEEEEEKLIDVSEVVTVPADGDIDMAELVTTNRSTVVANGIASPRASTPDSIASSRPSPPSNVPQVAYASTPRIPAGASTTEDEDDNTDIEENEVEPDEQPKSILTAKSRYKPNLRIDASAQLPSQIPYNSVGTPPSSFPPNISVSDKSPITPSSTTATATNSKAKASRGGRGRGRGRGRARTRGMRVAVPLEADRPPASGIDEVGTLGVNIQIPPSKEDAMDIEVNVDDATARNFKSKLTKVAAFKDETLESEEGTSLADVNKVMLDPDPDPSDKSDAEPEPDVEVDVDQDVDAPSDVSDGEDEKEDDDDEGEGEDEKDDVDELEVDEVQDDDDKEDDDKDDEDKEVSDKEDVEKDIDDDDRSEINLEDEEEESDLQPAHRVEALDMLAIVELKFALLREKLYMEKMEELAWEESLVASGEHPELIFIQSELLSRKNKRLELSERKCTFEIANITKRRKIDEDATWSSWKHQRDELQTDMIAENNRKRRKLERERRAVDRPQTARRIPFPPSFDFLPPAPTLRQIVDSFPFANSDRIIRNHRHKSLRKTQSSKSQIQQNHFHRILHGINTHATPGLTVAYPELSTLSSSESQGDLENLLSITGARRSGPGSTQTNTMGMGMNMSVGNNGLNMDMNINLPIYEQGVHGPPVGLGHVYTPGSGTHNGSNPIRERLGPGSSSLSHGPGPARRIVSGPGTLSGSSLSSQSTVGMGHVHEPPFVVGGLPPPPMGIGGGSESLLPSFGPSRSMGGVGPRSGSTAGLKSGSAGGGVDREREIRSVPSGSGGSGGRSSFHNGQSQHLFSDHSTTTNGAFPESEHQRDGDVVIPSSASSSVHGIHGRQVSSSTHFGPPGPGIGGGGPPSVSSPRKRSISPIGPSVGIGLNSIKGNGQWMGPGMGMGGFGTGHRWEAEEHERELERTEHTDAGDIRGQERDRDRERDRERDRDRDQHIVHQHRHIQQEQQHARPQSAGALNAPSHVHPYPDQTPHHHHHVRPHHHHIVHHHGPSSVGNNTSLTVVRGPSLSPRMRRGDLERERENGNRPPRTIVHRHPPTEVVNLTSSKLTPVGHSTSHFSSNRIPDDSPLEYHERQRDGRRMNGGRPSSGSGLRLLDERERERDRDRDRNQASTMPLVSGLNFQAPTNGVAISSSASSSRPPSWNAINRDDPYRPNSMHSSSSRRPSSSNASSSSPIHTHGSILPGPSLIATSSTISPPRTRALPPRAASPAVAAANDTGPLGQAESRIYSPPPYRERSPLTTSQIQTNPSHNAITKVPPSSSPPPTNALVSLVLPTNIGTLLPPSSLPMSTPASASSFGPSNIDKNSAFVKNINATVTSPLSISPPNPSISNRTTDASLSPSTPKRMAMEQMEDGHS